MTVAEQLIDLPALYCLNPPQHLVHFTVVRAPTHHCQDLTLYFDFRKRYIASGH